MEDWKYRQILSAPLALSSERLDDFVEAFVLPPRASVLEIGCGEGGLMVTIARQFGATCTGLDDRPATIARAWRNAQAANVDDLVNPIIEDAFAFRAIPRSFDATLSLAGTWVLGGFRRTLIRLAEWTLPGGIIAIGETFAFEPPEAAYFRGRSVAPSAFRSHEGNIAIGIEEGLQFVNSWQATQEEWDAHHESQFGAARRWLAANPADGDALEVRSRIDSAERRYFEQDRFQQRWATYLFKKPTGDA